MSSRVSLTVPTQLWSEVCEKSDVCAKKVTCVQKKSDVCAKIRRVGNTNWGTKNKNRGHKIKIGDKK